MYTEIARDKRIKMESFVARSEILLRELNLAEGWEKREENGSDELEITPTSVPRTDNPSIREDPLETYKARLPTL